MSRLVLLMAAVLALLVMAGSTSAAVDVYSGTISVPGCGYSTQAGCGYGGTIVSDTYGDTMYYSASISASFDYVAEGGGGCDFCGGTSKVCSSGGTNIFSLNGMNVGTTSSSGTFTSGSRIRIQYCGGFAGGLGYYICRMHGGGGSIVVSTDPPLTASGNTACVGETILYVFDGDSYHYTDSTTASSYSFDIYNTLSYRIVFDGVYYDFVCDGNEAFDYDACIYVYGYTCGVDNIKLYKDDGGWVLDDSVGQSTGYDVYEMPIVDGENYKISFIDSTIDGDFVVHNQSFSCTGDHVHIDYDRCEWVYPPYPPAPPTPIYIWTGYDYNIVVFRDEHGNFIENSQLAIYDKTDNQYLQWWTDTADGYTLLGTRFDTDHDVLLSLRTFDGVFTLDTIFPANGSAPVGEENITTTNWTIPIKYNLKVLPVDQYGASLFDVFCGLSEYTPLNPGAFWGMDLSDRGYVAVTNCSGFAMCDIIAEKEGYADYKIEALNWTSKSALVKDYRHNIVMGEE